MPTFKSFIRAGFIQGPVAHQYEMNDIGHSPGVKFPERNAETVRSD